MAEEPDVSPQALARMAVFGRRGAAEAPAGAEPSVAEEIDRWRQRIDEIDSQLNRLLNARSACALEIGRVKRRVGLAIYSPEREAAILERVTRENPGPLDGTAIRRVFERIIDESRRLERIAGEQQPSERNHRDTESTEDGSEETGPAL